MKQNLLSLTKLFYRAAMALDALEFDNLHDKKLKSLLGNRMVLVYHGTSVKKLAKILQYGSFDPVISSLPDNKTYHDSSSGIFVTLDPGMMGAEMYAAKNVNDSGGEGVVIQLEIPMSWIQPDPDDTEIDENGKLNSLGKKQGIVHRKISVRNIREIKFFGEEAVKIFGGVFETDWMTIGKALDKIQQKAKKEEIGEEYLNLISGRPKFLKKSPAPIDREQELATKLSALWGAINDPYHDDFEKFLFWLLENKSKLQQKADVTLLECLTNIDSQEGPKTFQELLNTDDYAPKKWESFWNYLRRLRI